MADAPAILSDPVEPSASDAPVEMPPLAPSVTPALTPALTPEDLADLLGRFNDVTAKLQGSHEKLNREVHRLRGELREANEQLARSRRLAALGEMAAGIAHEIRNPLGSIGLYARLLDEDLAELPDSRETALKIGRAVRGLEAIVQDVLSFAGGLRIKPAELRAGDLFDATLEAIGPSATQHVAIKRAGVDQPVHGDWGLLKQALVNLVKNAVDAMAESDCDEPSITLAARATKAGRVVLRVRDSGPGIAPEALDRMFNPFYTTRASGTGLGLAIVHRILDAHGGSVRAQNNRNSPGATVELRLPPVPAAGPTDTHTDPTSPRQAATPARDIEQEQAA